MEFVVSLRLNYADRRIQRGIHKGDRGIGLNAPRLSMTRAPSGLARLQAVAEGGSERNPELRTLIGPAQFMTSDIS
jgi:hypothetical protein